MSRRRPRTPTSRASQSVPPAEVALEAPATATAPIPAAPAVPATETAQLRALEAGWDELLT